MAWYQCSCGALKEESPQLGDTIVSIYHLHHAARFDGGSAIVRMQEIPAPMRPRSTQLSAVMNFIPRE